LNSGKNVFPKNYIFIMCNILEYVLMFTNADSCMRRNDKFFDCFGTSYLAMTENKYGMTNLKNNNF